MSLLCKGGKWTGEFILWVNYQRNKKENRHLEDLIDKKSIHKMIDAGEYEKARSYLKIFIENYSFDILYDDALYSLAKIYEFVFR